MHVGRKAQGMTRCELCGEEWPRDPALEVECPTCKAEVGRWCRRPSGHRAMSLHADRDRRAMAEGKLKPCPGRPQAGQKESLFEYVSTSPIPGGSEGR